jgi:hypothetical protein
MKRAQRRQGELQAARGLLCGVHSTCLAARRLPGNVLLRLLPNHIAEPGVCVDLGELRCSLALFGFGRPISGRYEELDQDVRRCVKDVRVSSCVKSASRLRACLSFSLPPSESNRSERMCKGQGQGMTQGMKEGRHSGPRHACERKDRDAIQGQVPTENLGGKELWAARTIHPLKNRQNRGRVDLQAA